MRSSWRRARYVSFVWLVAGGLHAEAAVPFTPGNLLIVHSESNTLREYTPAGALVQKISVPLSGSPATEYARDVTVFDPSHVAIYNGSFMPWLSRFDAQSNVWTHDTEPGWSTVNNGTFGGITHRGDQIFVTDMNTGQPPQTQQGLLRFDPGGSTWTRFGSFDQYIDVTLGLDGRLYALSSAHAYDSGGLVRVFDPDTLAFERNINLTGGNSIRGIAVNAAGEIFAAGHDKTLRRFDGNGNLLSTLQMGVGLADVDLSSDHRLLAVGGLSVFVLTDQMAPLSSFTISATYTGIFGAFVVPEPATILLLALGGPAAVRRPR